MQHAVLTISEWLNLSSIVDIFNELKDRIERYRRYRETLNDLAGLTDKELNDIGINRGMIRSIAMEIYYDNR